MYRQLICLALCLVSAGAHALSACPVTVAGLTLSATSPRTIGASPLLVFFDATATTSSVALARANTVTQDVSFQWNFSDSGVTGSGVWAWGPKTGFKAKNAATGIVAAHLYTIADGVGNKTYTPIVAATANNADGSKTVATCSLAPITVQDPVGVWPTTATSCYSSSGTFTGCPAGANHVTSSTISAITGSQSNKRLLYRCGETFTGDNQNPSGTKWSIGAFPPLGQAGSCAETKVSRPIFSDTIGGGNYTINSTSVTTDTRISDIDFEGNVSGSVEEFLSVLASSASFTQSTLNNLRSNGNASTFFNSAATQFGIVNSEAIAKVGGNSIALFLNSAGHNCVNFSSAFNCGGTPNYININYLALIGTEVTGTGGVGGNIETVRIGGCRYCVISSNYLDNAISNASNLKFGSANTFGSCGNYLGEPTIYVEISDNNFGTQAGGMEISPQNGGVNEHLQLIVAERNIMLNPTGGNGTRQTFTSAQNLTLRDNVLVMVTSGSNFPQIGIQPGSRGACQLTGTCLNSGGSNCALTGSESIAGFLPTGQEYFNNTGYAPTGHSFDTFIQNDTTGQWGAAARNSFIQGNLFYVGTAGSGYATVVDAGTGNTVSNNTANTSITLSPGFINGSGLFNEITDFKPAANFSGGIATPNLYDALGVLWGATPDLGAVKH